MILLGYYLIISMLLFFIGIYGFLTQKNIISILISLELILNSVEINFLAFNRYLFPNSMEGLFFSLFGIIITVAETAISLAIIINAYREFESIDIEKFNKMKK